ncbi:MAG: CHAT domain-containing protein, partial [Candidatus Sumerlaeota bacterium]|nr:CHAT domain-containing protein [Candidatus Sumerlaeota bacterium]
KAVAQYQQAVAIDQRIGDVESLGHDLNNMGYALMGAGRVEEAVKQLADAIEAYEEIRGRVRSAEERTGFQSTLPDVYNNLAASRIALGDPPGAFEAVERGRSKSLLDLLATRELKGPKGETETKEYAALQTQLAKLQGERTDLAAQPAGEKTRSARATLDTSISTLERQRMDLLDQMRRADPELGALVAVESPGAKEIQALLPDGATLVEFYHDGENVIGGQKKQELWVFVVKKSSLELATAPVSMKTLTDKLEAYAKLLADRASDAAKIRAAGEELAQWLVRPVEVQLGAGPLIIVPWGPMFKVPFAALPSAAGGPMGAQRDIVMAPSAGVYRYLAKKRAAGRGAVCALGNPETQPLAPLPGAEREAAEVAALFPKSIVKLKGEATESYVKSGYDALGRPDVAHFACHGLFNEKIPQFSQLALTPDRKNDGKLEVHEIFGLDWRGVSLVTLSACSSGKGKLGAGDDLVGLTRGFMFAGAPSVLCSLWDVDDEATRALMVAFYKNYLGGMSKPQALREAQRAVRENAEHPDWSHPCYWAAFTLWGDWQ